MIFLKQGYTKIKDHFLWGFGILSDLTPSSCSDLLFSQGLWRALAAVLFWSTAAPPSPQLLSWYPWSLWSLQNHQNSFFTPPYTKIITYSRSCHPNSTSNSFWNLLFPWEFFLPTNWQQFSGTSQLFPSCWLCLAGHLAPTQGTEIPRLFLQ